MCSFYKINTIKMVKDMHLYFFLTVTRSMIGNLNEIEKVIEDFLVIRSTMLFHQCTLNV